MKTVSANFNSLCHFTQLPVLNVVDVGPYFLVRDLCRSGCRDSYASCPYVFLPTHNPLRWDKVIMIGRVCIVQHRVIFSFHLAEQIHDPDPG